MNDKSRLLESEHCVHFDESALSTSFDGIFENEKTTFKCLDRWLTFCGYKHYEHFSEYFSYWWRLIMIIFLTAMVITAELTVINQVYDWYLWFQEIGWLLTVYTVYFIIRRNFRNNTTNTRLFQIKQKSLYYMYYCFIITFVISISYIRFGICESEHTLSLTGSIASYIVNNITLHTLNCIIFYLSCIYIEKCNHLKNKIINDNDITVEIIKIYIVDIRKWLNSVKQQWELISSIAFLFYVCYPTIIVLLFLSNASDALWLYCGNDSWMQVFMVIVRGSIRIFALILGVMRINQQTYDLAQVLNDRFMWNDDNQRVVMQTLMLSLTCFPFGFKICFVRIEWKHLWKLMVVAVTASLSTYFKSLINT
eukprot:59832_1